MGMLLCQGRPEGQHQNAQKNLNHSLFEKAGWIVYSDANRSYASVSPLPGQFGLVFLLSKDLCHINAPNDGRPSSKVARMFLSWSILLT